jgi:branched-chain amino acid transport system substrate-binding protein
MSRRLRQLVIATLSLVSLCGCAGPGKKPQQGVILVGEFLSLTGTTATFGQSTKNGVELAINEVNAKGGALGKKMAVIAEDDRSMPEEAANAVQKLINRDHVCAILGEVASSRSLAGAPYCQQARVPMISPSSTNPEVTRKGDYIFRACFTDTFQGEAAARFARNNLKLDRLAILMDVKNDYSKGLATFFRAYIEKSGGKIVAEQSYSEGDKDFRAQLTNIRKAEPDGIFIPGYYTEVALAAKQARELGLDVPLLGGDGWDSSKLMEIGGTAVEGSYISNHYSVDSAESRVRNFVQAYRKRYGETPDALAALGYDAAGILVAAIKRAGTVDGPALRNAIAATRDYPGVTGAITLDAERNARKPAVILKLVNGHWKSVTQINPQ